MIFLGGASGTGRRRGRGAAHASWRSYIWGAIRTSSGDGGEEFGFDEREIVLILTLTGIL